MVCFDGVGGGAVGGDDDVVIAEVGVHGGIEDAHISGDAGEDDGFNVQVGKQEFKGGGVKGGEFGF